MENTLLIASPYLIETLLPVFIESNTFGNQNDSTIFLLAEQFSGSGHRSVQVFNNIEDATLNANSIVILNDGYFEDSVINRMKDYFCKHKKPIKLIESFNNTNVLLDQTKYQRNAQVPFNNIKPTILLLNVIEPSQLLRAELMINAELRKRGVKVCLISHNDLLLKKTGCIPVEYHSDNMNHYLNTLMNTISRLPNYDDYNNADVLLLPFYVEIAKMDNYTTYLFKCMIDTLNADYILCCAPWNSDIPQARDFIAHKFSVNIDSFYISDYILNPDYQNRYLKVAESTGESVFEKISLLCDDIIMKLTAV